MSKCLIPPFCCFLSTLQLLRFSFLPFSLSHFASAGTYPAEGVQRAASSSDPLISSDLQAVETLAHSSGPSPWHLHQGGLSWNGNSEPPLVSARGSTAGTPLALLGRLPCPGKPRHGDGGSGSQPEELSCGRALAPTTRRIPAPSCESNWHSVGW